MPEEPNAKMRGCILAAMEERHGYTDRAIRIYERSIAQGPDGFSRETLWRALEIASAMPVSEPE